MPKAITPHPRILVTGASGLVGSAVVDALLATGHTVGELDIRSKDPRARADIRDISHVRQAMADCDGIVHLAAVSRVITAETDPELCWSTNVDALGGVLDAALSAPRRPWFVFASSREVYGQASMLPADEDCPLAPVNIYGRSKVAGENLVEAARQRGLRACIVRLSNVFGSVNDHKDRVIPAFLRAALERRPLRVDGDANTFDFTHIGDVTRGIVSLTRHVQVGGTPPPIHFVGGVATTLGQAARMAIDVAGSNSPIHHAPPRDFDVARFVGNPARAKSLLSWEPQTSFRAGLELFADELRRESPMELHQGLRMESTHNAATGTSRADNSRAGASGAPNSKVPNSGARTSKASASRPHTSRTRASRAPASGAGAS